MNCIQAFTQFLLLFFFVAFNTNLLSASPPLQKVLPSSINTITLADTSKATAASTNIIEFPLKKPFIKIAQHEAKVKYKMASFHFKDKAKKTCTEYELTKSARKGDVLTLEGQFTNCDCGFVLTLNYHSTEQVSIHLSLSNKAYNRLWLSFLSDKEEQVFGFGEQFSHVNMKGKAVPIFTEEQGLGRGDKPITRLAKLGGAGGNAFTTYCGIPFFITTGSKNLGVGNRAMFVDNSEYIKFDLTKEELISIELWGNELKADMWMANNPLDLIEAYTEKTGRMPELPDWAYGTWIGLQGGAEKSKRVVAEAKAAGNPVTAIWIQDWVGKRKTRFGSQLWWNWRPDEATYPDFKNYCQAMNKEGVMVLGYINSFLPNEREMVQVAKKEGYLIKTPKGKDYEIETAGFPAYLVDLTNPDAFEWMKGIIKTNMIEGGLHGWMADFGEWSPWDAKLHSGEDPKVHHNRYPVEWARLNREAIQEMGKEGEIVFFSRAGYSYSNQYSTAFWMGDQMVNWGKNDGIGSTIPAALSSGLSGIAINHSDIGGYTTVTFPFVKVTRSEELLFRWSEMNAFMPIYRTHEGLKPDKNAQVYSNKNTVDFYAKMGKLHYALKPYFKLLAKEASLKGYPLIRHTWLHYPNDVNTYNLEHQFLLGEDLLVVPVIEKSQKKVKGYFPAGNWEHIWSGKVYKGKQWHTVDAPLGKPAAFIKVGGNRSEDIKKMLAPIVAE